MGRNIPLTLLSRFRETETRCVSAENGGEGQEFQLSLSPVPSYVPEYPDHRGDKEHERIVTASLVSPQSRYPDRDGLIARPKLGGKSESPILSEKCPRKKTR